MGNRDDRAFVVLEVLFQPANRLGVQVVGRFVQQQDVRLFEQQATERHTPPFTAGEHVDGRVAGRAAQGVHGQLQLAVQIPCVQRVQAVLHLALAVHELVHFGVAHGFAKLGVDLVELAQRVHHLLRTFFYDLAHGLAVVELGSCSR